MIGVFIKRPKTVIITPLEIKREKALPMIFSASSILPLPLSREQRGARPRPKRLAKARIKVIIGKV